MSRYFFKLLATALLVTGAAALAQSRPKPASALAAQEEDSSALRALEERLYSVRTLGAADSAPAELAGAVALAMNDYFAGVLPSEVTIADLARESVRHRDAARSAPAIAAAIARAILAGASGAEAEAHFENATSAACLAATPKLAAEIVSSEIAVLAAAPLSIGIAGDHEGEGKALIAPEAYAGKVVSGAIRAIRKVPTADMARDVEDIAARALAATPAHLVQEIAAAVSRASASGGVILSPLTGGADNLLKTMLLAVPDTKEDAAAVLAGVLRGRGDSVYVPVRTEAAAARPACAEFLGVVADTFHLVAASAKPLTAAYITGEGAGLDRAALLWGACARWPGEAPKFTQFALEDLETNTPAEIVRAAVRAVQSSAAQTVAVAAGVAGVDLGEIARGATEGAHGALAGAIVSAEIDALAAPSAADVKKIVAGAIAGLLETGKPRVLVSVTFQAALTSRFALAVAEQALASAPAGSRYVAALSAVAADRGAAASGAIARVAQLLETEPAQKAAFEIGAAAATLTQANVRNFFKVARDALATAKSDQARLAVIYGVGLVNPKGIAAIAAAAVAKSDPKFWEAIVDAAIDVNAAKARSIVLATDAAKHVMESGTADVYDIAGRSAVHHPNELAAVAAGVAIAAPEYAHLIGHAIASRSGAAVARVVPALFAFALENARTPQGAAARITAGVMRGLLEAGLGGDERVALTAVFGAAIQSAVSIESASADSRQPERGQSALDKLLGVSLRPGGMVEGVVRAAVAAAPQHGLAFARAAAQALAYVTDGGFSDAGGLLATVVRESGALDFTGAPASPEAIQNAIGFGIAERNAIDLGARTLDLVNYSHQPGTNGPVTAILDL